MREANTPCSNSITCLASSAGSRALCSMPTRPSSVTVSRRVCRREHESLARLACEAVEPGGHELLQPLGDGQRLRRIGERAVGTQRPRELEGIERIAARCLVQPEQRRPRHRAESRAAEQLMRRADAERPDSNAIDPVGVERGLDRRRLLARVEPTRPEQQHAASRAAGEARTRARSPRRRRATGGRRSRRRARPRRAAASALRTATPSARGSTGRPAASSTRSATSSARRCGAVSEGRTSSRAPSNRSPRPAWARPRSDSAGREESTRSPRPRAASTAALQSVDFPIPASPSSAIAIGPGAAVRRSRNAYRDLRSSSLPMTSTAMCSPRHRDRADRESQVRDDANGVADPHTAGGGDGAVDAEGQRLVMAVGPVAGERSECVEIGDPAVGIVRRHDDTGRRRR